MKNILLNIFCKSVGKKVTDNDFELVDLLWQM
jgi:hypothetical protein